MNTPKKILLSAVLLFLCTSVFAESMIEIPGIGEVGYEKKDDSTYTFGIPKIGTFDFKGVFNSPSDFDLKTTVPVSAVTDYIPLIGQLLGILGLDSVTYQLTPNGLGLKVHLEKGGLGMFREYIVEELWLFEWQRIGTEALISTLEIKTFDMESLFDGPSLTGKVSGSFSVIGINMGFGVEGTLSFEAIIMSIIDQIVPLATDYIAKYAVEIFNDSIELVSDVGSWGLDQANYLIDEVGVIAHDVSTSVSHGSHSFDTCYNQCTVNYANEQRNRLLEGSNQIFQDFYNQVYRDIRKIEGPNDTETQNLRKQVLDAQWFNLVNRFNGKWQHVYDDDEVENYFFRSSSERQARDRYRSMIQESWNHHKDFTNQLYNQLMTIKQPLRTHRTAEQTYNLLQNAANTGRAVQFLHCEDDFAWDNPWNNQLYQDNISIYFFQKHEGWNQMWYLYPAGKDNSYYIQSAQTGKFIHIKNGDDKSGSTLVTYSGYGSDNTVFRAEADDQGNVTWYSKGGFAFDLSGGNPFNSADLWLWEPNHSTAQKFYINIPSVQPTVKPGVYTQILNAEMGGMINVEYGDVQGEADYKNSWGWHSAMWVFEPEEGGTFRIKNRWKGTYLHIEYGSLEASDIPAGSWSSSWRLEEVPGTDYVRIQNKWKPELYLHHNRDVLECATIDKNWKSAMWKLQYVEE